MDVWEKWREDKERRRVRRDKEIRYFRRGMSSILSLNRKWYTDKTTIGELSLDNEFQCHTLEDTVRDLNKDGVLQKEEKVYGETAIPSGTYEIVISHSDKFHKKLPLLLDVPHFKGVRIHSGNIPTHTLGCILVGYHSPDQPDCIVNSRATFSKLFKKIEDVLNYRKLYIEINGGPGA